MVLRVYEKPTFSVPSGHNNHVGGAISRCPLYALQRPDYLFKILLYRLNYYNAWHGPLTRIKKKTNRVTKV